MNEEPFISTAEKIENNRKSVKKLNIATVIVSVIALAGIGYGIYSAIQVIDKNQQIASLKAQLNANSSTKPGDTDSDGGPEHNVHDINEDQDLWLFHYASETNADGDRYTLVLSRNEDDKKGFYNLVRSSATDQELSSGHFEFDNEKITLLLDASSEATASLAQKMGFSFTDNKYSTSVFDEHNIKLGKVLFERVR
jgi:hypothetical protein